MPIDFRSFQTGRPAETRKTAGVSDESWWDEVDPDESAKRMVGAGQALVNDQTYRSQANLLHARLYGNTEILGFGVRDYARSAALPSSVFSPRTNLNVIASCVDTLHAKITKNKPRPMFLTDGAGWKDQQKARRLNKFMQGVFYETKAHRIGSEVFRHAEIFGTSGVKVCRKNKKLHFEHVFIDEILVEDSDGIYGEPQVLFHRTTRSKSQLLAEYPDKEDIISSARLPEDAHPLRGWADRVEVWEAWRLPSKKGAGDGRHVIAVSGGCLFEEEWKSEKFPFVFMKLFPRVLGFWGQGVCERLMGIQLEINRLMRSIGEQLRRKGRGRIFVQKGSGVVKSHLTNGISDIVEFVGEKPVVDNQNAVAAEEFMQLERLYQKAFQEVGISELSAGAKKPSGLDAAVALREFNDIESERFVKPGQAYEDFFMDLAELCLELVREQGSYKVKVPHRQYTETVDFADIAMAPDEYTMQCFPVSSLPTTPAARYQKVKEMMQDQFIDKAVAQKLLDFPDIEAESNLGTAALEDADATISAILDEETPVLRPLEPYQSAPLIAERGISAYLFARNHGCDEKRLRMLSQLIEQAASAVTAANTPTPMLGAAPPPGPAAPMPAGPPAVGGDVNINAAPGPAPAVPPLLAA